MSAVKNTSVPVLSGRSVPVANRPDKYRLDQARQDGRTDFKAGGVCLAPLKYANEPSSINAWLDGYLEAYRAKRTAMMERRRLPLRDAWPNAERNSHSALRRQWQGGAPC